MTKELTTIETKISPVVAQADALKIKSDKDLEEAVELLSNLNKSNDLITATREKVTKPLLLALNEERKRWKPMQSQLEEAIKTVRTKISKWQTTQKEKSDKKEAEIVAQIGSGKDIEKAVEKLDKLKPVGGTVSTGAGKVQFKTEKKFEVVDHTKLPWDFLVPNETAIRNAMKNGLELSGVRYWNEEVPVNYRR